MGDGERRECGGLTVHPAFYDFIETELLPAVGFESATFWAGVEAISDDLAPLNRKLLKVRDSLQKKIDAWHIARQDKAGAGWNPAEYRAFLTEIGYLTATADFPEITTTDVDREIAEIAGPQLVVPVSNARFAINAANARWGSLYDALYGTDVIIEEDGQERGSSYNPRRGAAVIRYATEFLDRAIPLVDVSHGDVNAYGIDRSADVVTFVAALASGETRGLREPDKFVGFNEEDGRCEYLFRNHGLHIEIRIDPGNDIGKDATANVADVFLESAVTTIQDCEDSVAAVDAVDKVGVYRNWLGLMRGDLQTTFRKGDEEITRSLAVDRKYQATGGGDLVLSGRSLLLVRNVGLLMTSDAIRDVNGEEIFEGILDAIVTTACALTDRKHDNHEPNSRTGSIYIVKPKMHGADEVAFADELFARVERLFDLQANTLKIGIMDEERRTTVNLPACVGAARHRVVFINTGFLDRTGDEIHTSMRAGSMLPKSVIKDQAWIAAYEDWNVDVGIRCGLPGKAQIGKGMWPTPDEMQQMMASKQAHPEAGASCAWVPSPTAATLHAMHYHYVDVRARQQDIATREIASMEEILTPPLAIDTRLSPEQVQAELDNNAQGILGYVVRWINSGVGCSKVPDIHNAEIMEDRATLRISSQHIANWLLHGVASEEQVIETFRRMAEVVDKQNGDDVSYERMSDDFESSIAFEAACALVFEGCDQPNGYTEPLLHEFRRRKKAQLAQ